MGGSMTKENVRELARQSAEEVQAARQARRQAEKAQEREQQRVERERAQERERQREARLQELEREKERQESMGKMVDVQIVPPQIPHTIGANFVLTVMILNRLAPMIPATAVLILQESKYFYEAAVEIGAAIRRRAWSGNLSLNVIAKGPSVATLFNLPAVFNFVLRLDDTRDAEIGLKIPPVPNDFHWFTGALVNARRAFNILCIGGLGEGKTCNVGSQLSLCGGKDVVRHFVISGGTAEHCTLEYTCISRAPCPLRFFDTRGLNKENRNYLALEPMLEGRLPVGADIEAVEKLLELGSFVSQNDDRARAVNGVQGTPIRKVSDMVVDPANIIHAIVIYVPYAIFVDDNIDSSDEVLEMFRGIINRARLRRYSPMIVISRVDRLTPEMRNHPDEPTAELKEIMLRASQQLGVAPHLVFTSVNYIVETERTFAMDRHIYRISKELFDSANQFCERTAAAAAAATGSSHASNNRTSNSGVIVNHEGSDSGTEA